MKGATRFTRCIAGLFATGVVALAQSPLADPSASFSCQGESMAAPFPPPAAEERPPRRQTLYIYLPPLPPPLDPSLVRRANAPRRHPLLEAGKEFYLDSFYPELRAFRLDPGVPAKQQRLLDEYLEEKLLLQREIRDTVAGAAALAIPERRIVLGQLAKIQEPRLKRLSGMQDRIRKSLDSANEYWLPPDLPRAPDDLVAAEPRELAVLLRLTAGFEPGLSTPQRDLIRLMAEQIEQGFTADSTDAFLPYREFLPIATRINFPAELPPGVDEKLSRIAEILQPIKQSLYASVLESNRKSPRARRRAFESLARQQAPLFLELEEVAEEIRTAFDAFPAGHKAAGELVLPPVYQRKVDALLAAQQDLRDRVGEQVDELKSRAPQALIAHRFSGGQMTFFVRVNRPLRRGEEPAPASLRDTILASLEMIAAAYRNEYQHLEKDGRKLQVELLAVEGFSEPGVLEKALVRSASAALIMREGDAFDDYRLAALTPGLSPAQRRLMLDAAMSQLPVRRPRAITQSSIQ